MSLTYNRTGRPTTILPLIITAKGTKQNYIGVLSKVIFVFSRPTLKKFKNDCLGPFEMRVNQKLIKNRPGNASIMHFLWSDNVTSN